MIKSFSIKIDGQIRRLKRKYIILKMKWFLLFTLPILLIAVSYQTAKQFLRLKMQRISSGALKEVTRREYGEPARNHPAQTKTGKRNSQE